MDTDEVTDHLTKSNEHGTMREKPGAKDRIKVSSHLAITSARASVTSSNSVCSPSNNPLHSSSCVEKLYEPNQRIQTGETKSEKPNWRNQTGGTILEKPNRRNQIGETKSENPNRKAQIGETKLEKQNWRIQIGDDAELEWLDYLKVEAKDIAAAQNCPNLTTYCCIYWFAIFSYSQIRKENTEVIDVK